MARVKGFFLKTSCRTKAGKTLLPQPVPKQINPALPPLSM
jgi:hypothetical protein